MPAAILRRYAASLSTTGATSIVPAVSASRALVIGKIVVAAAGTSTVTITVGGNPIVTALSLAAGQVYSEVGIVVLATETVTATAGTAGQLVVSVFGEEVDN